MKALRRMHLVLPVTLLAVMAYGAPQEDPEPPDDKYTLTFTTGYRGSSTEGELNRVAEYEFVDPSAELGLTFFTSPYDEQLFEFEYFYRDQVDQSGSFSWDANRVFRFNADYNSIPHRLDHDPLDNLNSVSEIKVTSSEDFEPGAEYAIRHQLFSAGAELLVPGVSGLSFRAGVREERRDGRHQQLSTSHCTSCHVTSQGRQIDQTTTDLTVGVHGRAGIWDLDYELLNRNFKDRSPTVTSFYEQAYHPAVISPGPPPSPVTPFNDRVWFQAGDYEVGAVPDVEKLAHTLKARASFRSGHNLMFTAVGTNTENKYTGLAYDFLGLRARFQLRASKGLRFSFYAEYDDIENDAAQVDLLAMNGLTSAPLTSYPGPAGVPNPISFQGWRGFIGNDARGFVTPDFENYTRESALNRTDSRLGVDVFWRARRQTSFRFGYKYRLIDRENVLLADGNGETASNTLKASWNERLARRLTWNTSASYTAYDNPYMNVDGGCREFMEDPNNPGFPIDYLAGSPKSPNSLQYYQLHQLRRADLSNRPSTALTFRSQTSWTPSSQVTVNANFRYLDTDNDDLDSSTWSRDSYGFGANLMLSPNPTLHYILGYDMHKENTKALTCIPLMDG